MNSTISARARRGVRAAALCLAASAAGAAQQPAGEQYRIGPRDVLTIRVTAPDIVQQFSAEALEVNECGTIPLLSVQNEEQNEVRAAGMTTNELQEHLRRFYTKYKRNPQVVVKVREYNSQPVAINGAVARPGQFHLRRPVRLLELLQFYAGGATDKSGGRVQIARMPALPMCEAAPAATVDGAAGPAFLTFRLEDTLKADERANPYLQPGDVITLPEAKEAYVVGNVLRPGPVPLRDDHLTVSRAIAMVGGQMPDSKLEKVRVVRQESGGASSREFFVDLKAIKERRAEDVALLPNDIVEVQVAGGKRLLRSLVGTVVPTVGQLPVQVIR